MIFAISCQSKVDKLREKRDYYSYLTEEWMACYYRDRDRKHLDKALVYSDSTVYYSNAVMKVYGVTPVTSPPPARTKYICDSLTVSQ